MNESKVVRAVPVDGKSILVDKPFAAVTHADYKALEERNESEVFAHEGTYRQLLKAQENLASSMQELASLKARVAELVEADVSFEECTYEQGFSMDEYSLRRERRRLALEALK